MRARRPPCGAEPFGGHPAAGMGGGRPLIRHGMRRDTFPPAGGKALGAALEAAPTGCLRSLRRGALCAPAGLPPAAPILPGQARYPRGVCPPIQHTRGGSTNGGMGVVLHPRRTRAPCQRPASPVSGVRGGCGLGDLGEAVVTPDTLPRRRFACFAAGGKVGRPAGRNPPDKSYD